MGGYLDVIADEQDWRTCRSSSIGFWAILVHSQKGAQHHVRIITPSGQLSTDASVATQVSGMKMDNSRLIRTKRRQPRGRYRQARISTIRL